VQKKNYISDEQLIPDVRSGDHYAFDQLFHKYGSSLFSFVVSVLKDESDAEEVVQDVFLKIWEKRRDLDSSRSFKSYLFTIALNTTKNRYRKKLQAEKYKQDVALELNIDQTSDFDAVEYRNLLDYVDKIIEKLPPSRREIFILSKKDGLKNPEIAKLLNISEQTVKNQLVSAMKFLRSESARDGNELGLLFFLLFYRL
jgi:RNA polymerase sigma-70 factor (ECF subfamily)